MKTKFEYVQKRSKRVVVVHDVPVERVLSDGSMGFSMATTIYLDKLIDEALAFSLPRVELWFKAKARSTAKAA